MAEQLITKQTCFKACKKVSDKADAHIKSLNVQIDMQGKYIKTLETNLEKNWDELERAHNQINVWYRKPEVMGPVGAVFGMLLLGMVQSR